jgi:FkbM family methyltransferase
MDVIGGVIARLDEPVPRLADRMRWRRLRRSDTARRVVDLLVARQDVVLDIGAAHGHFATRMLDLVGPRGAVHAFEPNPVHHPRLRTIAKTGPLTLHPVALSDHPGQATLHVPVLAGDARAGLASLEPRAGAEVQEVEVPVMRLDDVVGDEVKVAFIKCDVEGHEDAVMRGAEALLARDRPPVLVEIEQRHRAEDVGTAIDRFTALGYEAWAVFCTGLRPVAEFDLERDQLAIVRQGEPEVMPPEYVNDFLFAAPGIELGPVLDPGWRRTATGGVTPQARRSVS